MYRWPYSTRPMGQPKARHFGPTRARAQHDAIGLGPARARRRASAGLRSQPIVPAQHGTKSLGTMRPMCWHDGPAAQLAQLAQGHCRIKDSTSSSFSSPNPSSPDPLLPAACHPLFCSRRPRSTPPSRGGGTRGTSSPPGLLSHPPPTSASIAHGPSPIERRLQPPIREWRRQSPIRKLRRSE
jgi:hypothetical protein